MAPPVTDKTRMSTTTRTAKLRTLASLIWRNVYVAATLCAVLGWLATLPSAHAQPSNEKTFATPGDAVKALYDAAKTDDQAALSVIFGTSSGDLLHSGDEVADKRMIDNFVQRYD